MKIIIFIFFIFWFQLMNFCQVSQGIEFRFKTGFLAAHREVLSHLPSHPALCTEISYFKHLKSSNSWAEEFNFPTVGAVLFHGSVGNDDLLGKYTSIYGFADIPILHKSLYELSWRFGSGLGYTNRIYDPLLNPKNMAISTRINAIIIMGIKSTIRFKKSNISFGVDLTHFSNSAFNIPNYGINIPYFSVSYARTISQDSSLRLKSRITEFNKFYFGTCGIFSLKEISPHGNRKYPIYAFTGFSRYFFSQKAGLELGVDLISNQSIFDFESQVNKTQLSILQLGLYTGYLVPLNHFHFFFGMGVHMRDRYRPNGLFYNRIGFRYQLTSGLYGNITLKSHRAKADYMEIGLGYVFNFKKKHENE